MRDLQVDKRPHFKNLVGYPKFNRLLVIQYLEKRGKHHYWVCLCDCGKVKNVPSTSLLSGHTKSCGCLKLEINRLQLRTHGQTYLEGYNAYKCAKRRAAKLKRTPKWLTEWDKQIIKEIYLYCPDNFEVDHFIPLQSPLVSGLHVPENLQYLHKDIHKYKSNKFEPIYA